MSEHVENNQNDEERELTPEEYKQAHQIIDELAELFVAKWFADREQKLRRETEQ